MNRGSAVQLVLVFVHRKEEQKLKPGLEKAIYQKFLDLRTEHKKI